MGLWASGFWIRCFKKANRITQIPWDNQMNPEVTYLILDEVFLFTENFCRHWVFAFSLSCPCTHKDMFIAVTDPLPFSLYGYDNSMYISLVEITWVLYDIKVSSLGWPVNILTGKLLNRIFWKEGFFFFLGGEAGRETSKFYLFYFYR